MGQPAASRVRRVSRAMVWRAAAAGSGRARGAGWGTSEGGRGARAAHESSFLLETSVLGGGVTPSPPLRLHLVRLTARVAAVLVVVPARVALGRSVCRCMCGALPLSPVAGA